MGDAFPCVLLHLTGRSVFTRSHDPSLDESMAEGCRLMADPSSHSRALSLFTDLITRAPAYAEVRAHSPELCLVLLTRRSRAQPCTLPRTEGTETELIEILPYPLLQLPCWCIKDRMGPVLLSLASPSSCCMQHAKPCPAACVFRSCGTWSSFATCQSPVCGLAGAEQASRTAGLEAVQEAIAAEQCMMRYVEQYSLHGVPAGVEQACHAAVHDEAVR